MKTREIKSFFKQTESFLKNNKINEIIGIPYLNPHFPRSISYESKKTLNKKNLIKKIKKFFSRFISFSENFSHLKEKNFKYLIISHFVSYENLNHDNDFYFSNLAEKLGKDDVLIVLIDHIGFNKKEISRKINGNIIILSKFLHPLLEIKLFLFTSIQILLKNNKLNLKLLSLNNILSSVYNQRISKQVSKIVKKFNFKSVFFTFEGNPYEKLICNEMRNINNNIKIIGYQFSVLRKFQHSIYLNIGKAYNPDIIITIGNYNKKKLISKFNKDTKIINFGLLKKQEFTKLKTQNKKLNILVMPEGILEEIKIFEDFCFKNRNENLVFNLRLHPIFNKDDKLKKLILLKNPNIRISNKNLNFDFNNNSFILYRGTAASINAVKFGLIPIYLKKSNEVSVDPLYEVNKNHNISNNDDLLKYINNSKSHENKIELKKMKKFVEVFYDKPKFNKITKLM